MITERGFKKFTWKLRMTYPRWLLTEDFHYIWNPTFMKRPEEGFYHDNFRYAKSKDLKIILKAVKEFNRSARNRS